MKHVWILNHYALEPGGSGGTRHYSLARRLSDHGWNATVIAASTDYASGRQRLSPSEEKRLESFDGVPFLWLKARNYSGNGVGRVGNMLDYTRAVLRSSNLADLRPPDVIVGSSVHPLAAWAGRRLAQRFNVPFVFEVRDLWPQTLIDMGRISTSHPAAVALRILEKSLYHSARKIVVLLPMAGEYIEPLGVPREKIVWIPNGVDLDRFPVEPLRKEGEGFTLMYFGAHGAANGLNNLIDAMRIVEQDERGKHIALRLIGDGPSKAELMKHAAGMSSVHFEEPVPRTRIPTVSAQADAFVFNLVDSPVFRYGISSNKLFDFMAAARPVLFCCSSSNNPVAEAGAGVTVRPDNPEALADAILKLAAHSHEQRERMGQSGRKHLEKRYDTAVLAERLARTLDECVQAP